MEMPHVSSGGGGRHTRSEGALTDMDHGVIIRVAASTWFE